MGGTIDLRRSALPSKRLFIEFLSKIFHTQNWFIKDAEEKNNHKEHGSIGPNSLATEEAESSAALILQLENCIVPLVGRGGEKLKVIFNLPLFSCVVSSSS